jgi:FkbM family methyltransferase
MSDVPRKIAFVLAGTGHGMLILNRLDYRVLEGGNFYGVGGETLEQGTFEPKDVALMLQLLALRRQHFGNGVVALDIGANIGVHTVEWARRMTGWGRVIAVEAQERIFYALAGNIALNNCFNADAIHAAAMAEPGSLRVPVLNYQAMGSFGSLALRPSNQEAAVGQVLNYSEDGTTEVRGISIDAQKLPRADLIKIDVEGMEAEVLDGARVTVASFRPILFVEHIHSGWEPLAKRLESHGYRLFKSGMNMLAVHAEDPALSAITVT